MARSCEHGNEPLDSIKDREFLDLLSDSSVALVTPVLFYFLRVLVNTDILMHMFFP